jgi:hypothetical protein
MINELLFIRRFNVLLKVYGSEAAPYPFRVDERVKLSWRRKCFFPF